MATAASAVAVKLRLLAVFEDFLDENGEEVESETPMRRHRAWKRPWLYLRDLEGDINTPYKLQKTLLECDEDEYRRLLKMSPDDFQFVLEKIRTRITKEDTFFRKAIPAEERLSLTLKYLATGDKPISLSHAYKYGYCTVFRIIATTCQAIYDELGHNELIKVPTTEEGWRYVAKGFENKCQYPACVGAIDGKHIRIKKPKNSGTLFRNYKQFQSIILLAVVNANYQFMYIDVGCEGRASDSQIWNESKLQVDLEKFNLPKDKTLHLQYEDVDTHFEVPYHFVGDEAFGLSQRLLKPYSHLKMSDHQRIYNYRLSRARTIVENTFGILANRFQVLQCEISMGPDTATAVVLACCTLHNMLRERQTDTYVPPSLVDHEDLNHHTHMGTWRGDGNFQLLDLQPTRHRNPSMKAKHLRDTLAKYFMTTDGEVHWQYRMVRERRY